MNRIIQNLIAAITGYLTNLTTTDKSNLVAAINEVNAKSSGGGSQNIANSDLVADNDHITDYNNKSLIIKKLSNFNIEGSSLDVNSVYDAGNDDFTRNYNLTKDAFSPGQDINSDTITVTVNVDGINSDFIFTYDEYEGEYLCDIIAGLSVVPVSYTGQLIEYPLVKISVDTGIGKPVIVDETDGTLKRGDFYKFGLQDSTGNEDRSITLTDSNFNYNVKDFRVTSSGNLSLNTNSTDFGYGNLSLYASKPQGSATIALNVSNGSTSDGVQLGYASTASGVTLEQSIGKNVNGYPAFYLRALKSSTGQNHSLYMKEDGIEIRASLGNPGTEQPVNLIIGKLSDCADDTAAAAAGVKVNALYRNGSVLMIRVV